MRPFGLVVVMGMTLSGQALVEHAAAAAGGSVGGVAGKKVSEGLSTVFGKVDQQMGKAAKTGVAKNPSAPLMEVGPGVPKGDGSVPAPPAPLARHAAVRKPAPAAVVPPPAPPLAAPVLAPPPPPEVTVDDLKNVTAGMNRENVLKLGAPAARITMFEDGHVLEIYRYMAKDSTIGVVRLIDGSVATVQMP